MTFKLKSRRLGRIKISKFLFSDEVEMQELLNVQRAFTNFVVLRTHEDIISDTIEYLVMCLDESLDEVHENEIIPAYDVIFTRTKIGENTYLTDHRFIKKQDRPYELI